VKITWLLEDRRRGILSIFLDGEIWKQAHRSILGYKPALPQECREESELHALYDALEYAGAKKYAYQRLALKGHSSFEMCKQLESRLVSKNTMDRLIAELQQLGYINDEEWVQAFIKHQISKRVGPQLIKAKLRQKGIPSSHFEHFLENANQHEGIQKLLATRYRSRDLADYRERQKVVAALLRKGFNLDTILEALAGRLLECD
jgi:regulatory protein